MTAKNDITGDSIKTKASTEAFCVGYDKIFKKRPALNVADLKDKLAFLDQEAFAYDKVTNEFLGAPGTCPPPAEVFVWVNGIGACEITDLTFDPNLGIMIDINQKGTS